MNDPNVSATDLDPKEAIYRVLGGAAGSYPLKIDEILVSSIWHPNFALAEQYTSDSGAVILAGDAGMLIIVLDIPYLITFSPQKSALRRFRYELRRRRCACN